jgi:hypothetical protein
MHLRSALLFVSIGGYAWSCADAPRGSSAETLLRLDPVGQTADSVSLAGSFGFVNSTGTELLSLDAIPDPRSVSSAICGEGKQLRLLHVRTQSVQPESTHRQVAAYFGNEGGEVFQVLGDTAVPNETCFLAADSMLARSAGGVRPTAEAACQQVDMASLVQIAGRAVVRCAYLGEVIGGAKLIATQFATIGTSALAAVALVDDSVLLYHALPAQYRDSDDSTWRVDDGGVFEPEAIRVLFVARLPQGYSAAFVWPAAEGESDELVVTESTFHARRAVTGYRYWSPF